jgi:hypothetical protein
MSRNLAVVLSSCSVNHFDEFLRLWTVTTQKSALSRTECRTTQFLSPSSQSQRIIRCHDQCMLVLSDRFDLHKQINRSPDRVQ